MAKTIRAYPAPGRKVLDPRTGKPVAGCEGAPEPQVGESAKKALEDRIGEKLTESKVRKPEDFARDYPSTPYWVRRVRDGDMIELPPSKGEPPSSSPRKAKE